MLCFQSNDFIEKLLAWNPGLPVHLLQESHDSTSLCPIGDVVSQVRKDILERHNSHASVLDKNECVVDQSLFETASVIVSQHNW